MNFYDSLGIYLKERKEKKQTKKERKKKKPRKWNESMSWLGTILKMIRNNKIKKKRYEIIIKSNKKKRFDDIT